MQLEEIHLHLVLSETTKHHGIWLIFPRYRQSLSGQVHRFGGLIIFGLGLGLGFTFKPALTTSALKEKKKSGVFRVPQLPRIYPPFVLRPVTVTGESTRVFVRVEGDP